MTQVNFFQEVLEPRLKKSGFKSHHMALPVVVGKLLNLKAPHFLYLQKEVTRCPLQGC